MRSGQADRQRDGTATTPGQDVMFEALAESRALWKELCETIADLVFETDHQGRFTFLWPPDCLGWSADELLGRPSEILLLPPPSGAAGIFDPFRTRAPTRLGHVWLRRPDGRLVVMAISARPTSRGGTRGVGIDITEMDEAARAASTSLRVRRTVDRVLATARHEVIPSAVLRSVLDTSLQAFGAEGAALFRSDWGSGDAAEILQSAGEGWEPVSAMPGFLGSAERRADEPARDAATLVLGRAHAALRAPVETHLGAPCFLAIWRRAEAPGWTEEDRLVAAALAASLRHLVEADSLQHELVRAGRTDLLTGLLDRTAFLAEVTRRFTRLDRARLSGTMLSVDLDDFGAVNASAGLDGGDRLIRHLATALRDAVRPTDLVARIGGDEFAVWLDGADLFAAAERADALCRHDVFGASAEIGACRGWSIGLATRPPAASETAESLLRRADMAMLKAKADGKNRWCVSREEIGT